MQEEKLYHVFYSNTLFKIQQDSNNIFNKDKKRLIIRYRLCKDENMNDVDEVIIVTEAIRVTTENSGENLNQFVDSIVNNPKINITDKKYLGIGVWASSIPN